jgi:lactate dehydrogenase-like 2-hydroxyacid dehydrogenase
MVVVDNNNIAGDADFPEVDLPKYGWEQFPELSTEDLSVRCWRAEVVVSAACPIDKPIIDNSFLLKLIIAAGDSTDHIDKATAAERGIKVCHIPGLDPANAETNDQLCSQVIDVINSFYRNELIHEV